MSQTYTTNDPAPSVISTTEAMPTTPETTHTLPKPKYSQEVDELVNGVNDVGGMHKTLPVDIVRHIQHFAIQGLPNAAQLALYCFASDLEFSRAKVYRHEVISKALRPDVYQAYAFFYLLEGKFSRVADELQNCAKKECKTLCPYMSKSARRARGFAPFSDKEMCLFSKELFNEFKSIDALTKFESPKALEELKKLDTPEKIESYKVTKRLEQLTLLRNHPLYYKLLNLVACIEPPFSTTTSQYLAGGSIKRVAVEGQQWSCEQIVVHRTDLFDNFCEEPKETLDQCREYEYGNVSTHVRELRDVDTYRERFSIHIHCGRRVAAIGKIYKFHRELDEMGLDSDEQSEYNTQLLLTLAYALLDPRSDSKEIPDSWLELLRELLRNNIDDEDFHYFLRYLKEREFYTEEMMNLICSVLWEFSQNSSMRQSLVVSLMSHKGQKSLLDKDLLVEICLRSCIKVDKRDSFIQLMDPKDAISMLEIIDKNPLFSEILKDSEVKIATEVVLSVYRIYIYNEDETQYIESFTQQLLQMIQRHCGF